MRLMPATLTGNYVPTGNPGDATCVIAQTFGNGGVENGSIVGGIANEALADYIVDSRLDSGSYGPLLLQAEIADLYNDHPGRHPDTVADALGRQDLTEGYVDSWKVLQQAARYMANEGVMPTEIRPIIVAQAHHVGRVAAQVSKLTTMGQPIVPEGLPAVFDNRSTQSWTRSRIRWVARELLGRPVLKLQGKL